MLEMLAIKEIVPKNWNDKYSKIILLGCHLFLEGERERERERDKQMRMR